MLDEHTNRSGSETQQDIGASAIWPDVLSGVDIDEPRLSIGLSVLEASSNAAPPVKTFGLRDDGTPYSTKQGAQPARGVVSRHDFSGAPLGILHSVAALLGNMKSSEVLIPVPPLAKGKRLDFVTKSELVAASNAIARTKEHFPPVAGPALLPLDFDAKVWPPELRARVERAGGVLRVLETTCHAFVGCSFIKRASSSAGVRDRLTGKQTAVDAGHHWYFLVQDGRDISRFIDVLHQRLIIAGFGYGFISRAGLVLPRSIVDVAASSDSSRLWFEGPPILDDNRLEFVPDVRRPTIVEGDGGILDTRALPDLTNDEARQFEVACARIKIAMSEEARPVRQAYEEQRIASYVKKGMDFDRAKRLVCHSIDRQELYAEAEIRLDSGEVVSVGDILEAPEHFHKRTCADPLEWDYGSGQNLAVIHTDRHPYHIFSHAHGGARFSLLQSPWLSPVTEDPDTSAFAPAGQGAARRLPGRVITKPSDPATLPVRNWLIHPRYPLGDAVQITGEPGVNKSTYVLMDALIAATGNEKILRGPSGANPERLHRSGSAIIYNSEDSAEEMEKRLLAAERHFGIAEGDFRHKIVLWSGKDDASLTVVKRDDARAKPKEDEDGLALLEASIRAHNAVYVALDTQISLVAGISENDNDGMSFLVQTLARLAARCNCVIAIVHHTGKGTSDKAGDLNAGRGASSVGGRVRGAITLCKVKGERDDEKGLDLAGPDELIRVDYAKMSYARKLERPIIFRRLSVPVGNGSGSDQTTADAFFEDDPAAALRAVGDTAPVLEIVDVQALERSPAATRRRDERIARIALGLLKGQAECLFSEIVEEAGDALRSAKLANTGKRSNVLNYFTAALRAPGICLEIDGQKVRVVMEQRGHGRTSPWRLAQQTVTADGVFA